MDSSALHGMYYNTIFFFLKHGAGFMVIKGGEGGIKVKWGVFFSLVNGYG